MRIKNDFFLRFACVFEKFVVSLQQIFRDAENNMDEKVKYWLDIADYDYATAGDLFKSKRWLYVGFMCHQVIEKTLKAYWTATQETTPPYVHNLIRLCEGSQLSGQMTEEQLAFLDALTPMNIEARYPDYKSLLASHLNADTCQYLLNETLTLQEWIKSKL